VANGARISKIQAYTLARQPAEAAASPWSDTEMKRIGRWLREGCKVPVELYFERGVETSEYSLLQCNKSD